VTCENEPVLVFDGDCGFCTSSARWIEARLPADTAVEPWQSLDLDSLGLTEADVTAAAYWVDDEGGLHRGHLAIGRALVTAGGLWGIVGRLLVSPPLTWVARPVYALVARYRYKLPGATDACRLPD
jgi:predicted DCC family thiol-disulfide oxidoreductase YuxK